MSFIGPIPLLKKYLSKFSELEKERHYAKPGISGLSQVYNLNSKKNWHQRIRLDIFYVRKVSFYLDVIIYLKTLKIFFLRKQTDNFEKFFQTNKSFSKLIYDII